jgi:endonuclease/exonuclease/phosphatase family metal-dependent hydrolase
VPDVPRSLEREFTAVLAEWDWDVALLQEVPPWWPHHLARACGAHERTVLTSRNSFLSLRRCAAERRPDLIMSWGGGANAILVRDAAIVAHRSRRLRRRPERRVVHGLRLEGGTWICNVHAQVRPHSETREDLVAAAEAARVWAGGEPCLLGGDLNVRDPELPGFEIVPGSRGVDGFGLRGLIAAGPVRMLSRGELSDHTPVVVDVRG